MTARMKRIAVLLHILTVLNFVVQNRKEKFKRQNKISEKFKV